MARSLTVKHEEKPATSGLFNVFLLLAFGWLVAAMLFSAVEVGPADAPLEAGMILLP